MQGYNRVMKLPKLTLRCVALPLLSVLFCATATAQTAPKEQPEAKVEVLTGGDESVKIEELRLRGESQGVKVKPKNAPSYEIAPQSPAKRADDKSQGVRTWRLFTF
jgi:hypothetical protein